MALAIRLHHCGGPEELRTGRIVVPVAVRLPLAEAAQAHRISEGGHPGGRIVLTVREPPS